ncbi:MAG: hypothetical protein Q9190_007084, partial [Brigantiaea leucoxantha]
MNDRYPAISRAHSPVPTSPGGPGLTPSPLRDAMEDVMSSLNDMGMHRDSPSPPMEDSIEPLDPWSPDAFEELRSRPSGKNERPRTSLGIGCCPPEEKAGLLQHKYNSRQSSPEQDHAKRPAEVHEYFQRMENYLRDANPHEHQSQDKHLVPKDQGDLPPAPPPKNSPYQSNSEPTYLMRPPNTHRVPIDVRLRNRKSAFELGRDMLGRTFTNRSNTTNSSSGIHSNATSGTSGSSRTSQSIMSGYSAGGFSATSAGSLARRKGWGSLRRSRPASAVGIRQDVLHDTGAGNSSTIGSVDRASHTRFGSTTKSMTDSDSLLGGLTAPKPKKSGFLKKLVESAKTSAASARSSIAAGQAEPPRSPIKNLLPSGVNAVASSSAAKDMGLGGGKSGMDWVQIRRDVHRSNSLSRKEKEERIERCQMMGDLAFSPIEALHEAAEGNEGLDGRPIDDPINFQAVNFQLVDKSARFVNSLPPMTNPVSLAQGYVCRPYRSDVQRLRAIFTWVSEKIAWEGDFEGDIDSRRVIQVRRGCAEEVAVLVMEMCAAMGLHAEVVRGYLKSPGEAIDFNVIPRPNHWWNAVAIDNEWRMMDCSLASPSNPKREQYSSAGSQAAETGWFLTRPMEMCYTHVAHLLQQQHICPPVAADILLALPCACPPFFKNEMKMVDYDTSLCRMEDLELVHIQFTVPSDIECVAEVEVYSYAHDADGDLFESGDTTTIRALAQADWTTNGQKRYTVKAHLPGDEGQGVLKIFAGKRGLIHSINSNPHPLAFALPITHTGKNPPYEFFLRHPTPHAQRHDLYVVQPQCARLAVNNTFVFA